MFINVAREMTGRSKLKDLKNAQGGQTRANVTTVQVLSIPKNLSGHSISAWCFLACIFSARVHYCMDWDHSAGGFPSSVVLDKLLMLCASVLLSAKWGSNSSYFLGLLLSWNKLHNVLMHREHEQHLRALAMTKVPLCNGYLLSCCPMLFWWEGGMVGKTSSPWYHAYEYYLIRHIALYRWS